MADSANILDRIPLFPQDTEENIRARWNAWANEGLDPVLDGDRWTDVRGGGVFQLATEPGVRETARIYDRIGTEVVAAATPVGAWGQYLDDQGVSRGLDRLQPTFATTTITFLGDDGTIVPSGTRVGVPAPDIDSDVTEFETTEEATIVGGNVDVLTSAVAAGKEGNVAATAIELLLSGVPGVTGILNAEAAVGGTDEETDEDYRARILKQYGGGGNARDLARATLNISGVGRVTVIPLADGPGTVTIVAMTGDGTPVSETTIDVAQQFLDPPAFQTVLTSTIVLPISSIPVVSTSGAKPTGFLRVGPNGGQVLRYTGATSDHFTGVTGGSGSVVAGSVVAQGGRGGGYAQVGQHVKVMTGTGRIIDVSAVVEFEQGFSLDGDGGTVALRTAIEDALRAYIEARDPGEEIVYTKVLGAITGVNGVHDVGSLTVEGSAANTTLSANPPQYPHMTTPVLNEGSV